MIQAKQPASQQAPSAQQPSYVDSYEPPQTSATTQPSSAETKDQSLEAQNIFFLLGVTDGTNEEKEAFLDELQQVVWEDFLENDVELLITQEEKQKLDQIMVESKSPTMQEEMVVYLEKLIPDLEEIMLEKALELKADMVRERIAGMREYYAGKEQALSQISQAEDLLTQDQWRQAAETLNAI